MSDAVSVEEVNKQVGINPSYMISTFVAAIIASGFAGGRKNLNGWYENLPKSNVNPPNYVFPIAWTALYVLMSVAGTMGDQTIRSTMPDTPQRQALLDRLRLAYTVQLVLNVLWSLVFFQLHNIMLAFFINILLIGAITTWMLEMRGIDSRASWFMAPYLAWTVFALFLTGSILFKGGR